jgi:hypothetical protein
MPSPAPSPPATNPLPAVQAAHTKERTNEHSNVRTYESRRVASETFESLLPFLVCARNPALNDPSPPLPELRARLRYEVPSVSSHERDVLSLHLVAGHAVDPVSVLVTGISSARQLNDMRAGLRRQGWQPTRLGGRQFASPSAHLQVAMRWQLQKPAAGRPLRLPRPFARLLGRAERLGNELITWRFRHHLRLSPLCSSGSGEMLALAGVHTELLPVLTPAAARQLKKRGLSPAQLSGWLRHTVIDWLKARSILEADLKSSGHATTMQRWSHEGVYQGVPFDGRILVVELGARS